MINREKTSRKMSFGQDRVAAGGDFIGSVSRLEPDMVDKVARVWPFFCIFPTWVTRTTIPQLTQSTEVTLSYRGTTVAFFGDLCL